MDRQILYGILGTVFGLIGGAIILLVVYLPSDTLSGPDYTFSFLLLVFAAGGGLAGIESARYINTKYGSSPLSEDKNAPTVQAFFFVVYIVQPTLFIPLAVIIMFVLGGKIPLFLVIVNIVTTSGYFYRYKQYKEASLHFSSKWWLKQSEYALAVDILLYLIPINAALILILYLLQNIRM
jgi:hypothetical protein